MIYRKATFNDVEEIYNLVNLYAQEGVMLARSRNTLYETLPAPGGCADRY